MSDYAKAINWVDKARANFKARELKNEARPFQTWLDPFLSKQQIIFLGTSLDKAEWDIWFALLCRFRNFARFETEG